LLGVGIVLVVAATYPRGDELIADIASQPPSELSAAYLEAWLRIKPDSPAYLHSLATQYLKMGKWGLALPLADRLSQLAKDDDAHRQALLIKVAAAKQMAYQFLPSDPRRASGLAQFTEALSETLKFQWSVSSMESFANMAREAGATTVLADYYRKLASADTAHVAYWQEKLGDLALSNQAYDKASQFYFAAYDASATLADKRHYFFAALKALESGDQVNQACDEGARRIGALAHDRETLRFLLKLARQVNRTDLITRYARALADLPLLSFAPSHYAGDMRPQSPAAAHAMPIPLYRADESGGRSFPSYMGAGAYRYRVAASTSSAAPEDHKSQNQAEYDLIFKAFVESSHLDDAEKIAHKALDAHMDPLIWTHRLARIAQWNNHPAEALKYWVLYAQASGDKEAWQAVLKLAPQLDDDRAYLAAWQNSQTEASTGPANGSAGLDALLDQYMTLNHWESALRVIDRLQSVDGPKARQSVLLLEVTATENLAYQYPPGDPHRTKGMVRYIGVLEKTVHYQWDVPAMSRLAEQASQAGADDVAKQYYQRLAVADAGHAAQWLGQVGEVALRNKAYDQAAQAYFAAQGASSGLVDQRRYFLAALAALVSGDQVGRACAEGEKQVGDLDKDPETLRYLLGLARQASRKDLMARYARDLVKYSIEGKDATTSSVDYSAYPDYPAYAAARHAKQVQQARAAGRRFFGATMIPAVWHAPATATRGVSPARAVGSLDERAGVRYLALGGDAHIRRVAAEPAGASSAAAGKDSDYDLAYQAFIGSNQLDDAENLARHALEHHLDPLVWTRRLAQVAQWNNHPQVALKYWLLFAKRSGNEEAWENVLKLAPQLDDAAAYLAALTHASDRSPADLSLYDKVIATYERLGQPKDGMAFLKARAKGALRRPLLERYAALAQRSADYEAALWAYRSLMSAYPSSAQYAADAAALEFKLGRQAEALAMLRGVRGAVGNDPTTAQYWRLYADLARQADNDQEANLAYKNLLATGHSGESDLNAMTDFYSGHPIDAGRTAEMEFRKDDSETALRRALENYTAARAWSHIQALLQSLTPDQKALLAQSAPLLTARANYYLKVQRWETALADFRRAVALPDADDETRVSYLWALVDFGTDRELRAALDRWRVAAKTDSAYWGAFAAGEMRIGHAARAVVYLRQQGVQSGNDPLWLMSLADAEDAAGHSDLAWDLRRKAWRILQREAANGQLQRKPASKSGGASLRQLQQIGESGSLDLQVARVSLSQTYADGDYSRDLLAAFLKRETNKPEQIAVANSILADTQGLPPLVGTAQPSHPGKAGTNAAPTPVVSAVAKSTVLAWAASGEHNDLARAWLARQYVRRMLQPADTVVALALASNDRDTLARVLDSRPGQVPVETRIEALNRTGRTGQAETLAFEASGGAPENDRLHDTMTETVMRDRPSVGMGIMSSSQSPLRYLQSSVQGGVKLTNRVGLQVEAVQRNQRTTDTSQLAWVPAHDREYNLSLLDTTISNDFSLTVGHRDALASFYTGLLQGRFNREGPLSTQFKLGVNQFTDVSSAMQVGATKDMAQLTLGWNPQGHWFLEGTAEADRFHAQDRDRTYMGNGYNFTGAIGYRFRSDYPDWNIRFVGSRGIFSPANKTISSLGVLLPPDVAPTAREFLPDDFSQYGVMVGLGTNEPSVYSHAWRPFVDVGYVHDSNEGWGPQINLGLHGPLLGNDSLRIFFVRETASSGSSQRVTQIGLSYQLFY
jgi:hypothetical protein